MSTQALLQQSTIAKDDGYKYKISQQFNKASHTYETAAHVQKICAEQLTQKLLTTLPDFYPASILDLGTGSGYIPEILLSHFPQSRYTLNDIAPSMLEKAKKKFRAFSQFQFCAGDMENLNIDFHALTISNLALQWANDLSNTLKKYYANTQVLAFSSLALGTFQEWTNIFDQYGQPSPVHPYPSEKELYDLLQQLNPVNYSYETQDFQIAFGSPQAFMHYLKQLGASTPNTEVPFNVLKKIVAHQEPLTVTYKVFFGILGKLSQ